jgi:hypothetical protein
MNLTGNMRTTVAGVALLVGGLLVSARGVMRSDVPCSLGGMILIVTALILIALAAIRTWIGDARDERRELADSRRQSEAEQRRYFALQAALNGEMTRLNRDMALERARVAATLIAEREAMSREFEERRLDEQKEAFQAGIDMERAWRTVKPETPVPANLIQFPKQQPEQEHSREHGVVRP